LLEVGPPSIAEEYPFESLWEDFLLGMILWYPGYITVYALTLPGIKADPNGELRVQGLRMVVPRYVHARSRAAARATTTVTMLTCI
jgi:hypothetical protein